MTRSERSATAQCKSGILPIRVETGRFKGEEEFEQICLFCDAAAIENESHFCFYCENYSQLRQTLVNVMNTEHETLSDAEKFKLLWENCPRQMSKFVLAAFTKTRK